MIPKCIVLLFAALTLANCCASGNGCAPPPGASIVGDGLGAAMTDDTEPVDLQPKKRVRATREIVPGSREAAASQQSRKLQPKDSWEQQEAADQADEKRLKRVLTICRTCEASQTARDER
jgi:hypothetical protein